MAPSLEVQEPTQVDLDAPAKAAPKLVAPEPEHCPGPESQLAGKGDACAGCPNQKICASAPKGPDPDIPDIAARLENVRHKILVLSGKGGVGKSTLTAMLASGFAGASFVESTRNKGGTSSSSRRAGAAGDSAHTSDGKSSTTKPANEQQAAASAADDPEATQSISTATVGVMDADICGPSIPKLFGVEQDTVHVSSAGWSPVWAGDNLAVMSVQFMLPSRDEAVVWRGPKKNGLLKQFLRDVDWGPLDFLLVDTPPGTSDEHLSVTSLLKNACSKTGGGSRGAGSGIDGAVLVTTPQEVSLLDVRKELDFCRKAGVRVLGLVENMAGFVCPGCRHRSRIFRPTTGGARRLARDAGVRFLGSVPLDPRIGMACDYGEPFAEAFPDSAAARAVQRVVRNVAEEIGLELVADETSKE